MHSMTKYYGKIPFKKFPVLLFVLLAFSCTKKDQSNCYICTTTWIVTTDTPVTGYPASTSTEVELCDMTPEQITEFEQTYKGADSSVVGGVTYSSTHATTCKKE